MTSQEDHTSTSSLSDTHLQSPSALSITDTADQAADQYRETFDKFQERMQWASRISDPKSELTGLYDLLIDFAFTPLSMEAIPKSRPKRDRFVEQDITALKSMASKELGELQSKPERDFDSDEGDDILIDDINIHGDAEAELTAAESIVQSFFQPLVFGQTSQTPEEMTPEEIHYTQMNTALGDGSQPSRLIQSMSHDFSGTVIEHTQFVSGIRKRKVQWLADRFIDLSKLRCHPELNGSLQDPSLMEELEKAISFIIDSCTKESLEPAFLMLYKQQELEPLRKLLHGFGNSTTAQYKNVLGPAETEYDHAVCTGCAIRVYPTVYSDGSDSFLRAMQHCQSCGEKIRDRPCSLLLGRAIWDIVELHFRFERLASRVDKIASAFLGHHVVQGQVEWLTASMKHRYEVEFLDGYTKFLQDIEAAKNAEVCSRAAVSDMFRGELWRAYEDYAIDGCAYAQNVILGTGQYACRFQTETPIEWASQFTSKSMPSPAHVLSALRAFATLDIAIQPAILTKATELLLSQGIIELRYNGENLRMPLASVVENSAGILGMLHDTSVEILVDMAEDNWQKLLNFSEFYAASGHDNMTKTWNSERWRIRSRLIKEILRNVVPVLKLVLIEIAEWNSCSAYLDKLESMVSMKGYSRCALPATVEEELAASYHDDTWKEELAGVETLEVDANRKVFRYARVLAVYAPSNREPVTFAQLSETGSVVRMWQWPMVFTGSDAGKELFLQNLEQLKNFSVTFRPHVVAVSMTQTAQQRMYHTGTSKRSIFEILKEFFDHPMIEVVWTDIRLAKSFGKSVAAREEFPTLSYDEKVCVCIGRVLRDPLTEVVRLCNRHNDILRLQLVDEQCYHSQTRQRERIDQLLSLWVSACGVDVASNVSSREGANILQYVSGLDAQKADSLLSTLQSNKASTERRVDCAKALPFNDAIVKNCIGILQFSDNDKAGKNVFHIHDSTLIHPSYYSIVNESTEAHEAIDLLSKTVPCYKQSECRGKTRDFVLKETENVNSAQLMRKPFRKVSKSYFFEALTSIQFVKTTRKRNDIEDFQSLTPGHYKGRASVHVGDRISCRILALTERGITVFTSKFLKGFIPVGKIGFDDSYGIYDDWARILQSKPPKLQQGDHIDASVVGVNYDNLLLILSWNSKDLNQVPHPPLPGNPRKIVEQKQSKPVALSFKASRHLWFRPDVSSGDQARDLLKEGERGEIILRYCEKNIFGIDFKLSDFHVAHLRITEESINNEIRYVILDEQGDLRIFEDLDHCYNEYISALIKRFRDLETHPKAFCGSLQGLKRILKREAAENHKSSWRMYCSSRDPLYTAFVICSPKILGDDPQCWKFSLGPNGWRHTLAGEPTCASSIDDLLMSFQKQLKAKSRS